MPGFKDYQLAEGDVGTDIDVTCRDSEGEIINVTAADPIDYRWKHNGVTVVSKTGVVQDGAGGIVRYKSEASDIKNTDLTLHVKLTIAGNVWRSDPIFLRVNPKLL